MTSIVCMAAHLLQCPPHVFGVRGVPALESLEARLSSLRLAPASWTSPARRLARFPLDARAA